MDDTSVAKAREIARRTLDGEYDLLLACRDLAILREGLAGIPRSLMDTFIAVDSETADLPIGPERTLWSAGALARKDAEASAYREQVRDAVTTALREILTIRTGEAPRLEG
jgi:hypothetical protein